MGSSSATIPPTSRAVTSDTTVPSSFSVLSYAVMPSVTSSLCHFPRVHRPMQWCHPPVLRHYCPVQWRHPRLYPLFIYPVILIQAWVSQRNRNTLRTVSKTGPVQFYMLQRDSIQDMYCCKYPTWQAILTYRIYKFCKTESLWITFCARMMCTK